MSPYRTATLRRRGALEEVSVERRTGGTDRFGAPNYDTPAAIDVVADEVAEFRHVPDGDSYTVTLKLYFPATAAVVPNRGARITRSGQKYNVTTVRRITSTDGTLDHTYAECQDDGA